MSERRVHCCRGREPFSLNKLGYGAGNGGGQINQLFNSIITQDGSKDSPKFGLSPGLQHESLSIDGKSMERPLSPDRITLPPPPSLNPSALPSTLPNPFVFYAQNFRLADLGFWCVSLSLSPTRPTLQSRPWWWATHEPGPTSSISYVYLIAMLCSGVYNEMAS